MEFLPSHPSRFDHDPIKVRMLEEDANNWINRALMPGLPTPKRSIFWEGIEYVGCFPISVEPIGYGNSEVMLNVDRIAYPKVSPPNTPDLTLIKPNFTFVTK